MSFFAVLFALLIEQLKPLPRDNWVHDTLIAWTGWAGRNFDAGRDRHAIVVWCVTVLAPAIVAWLAHWALASVSLFAAFAFDIVVLYLTLGFRDRKSTRLNSSHSQISYAVFCLKKKKKKKKNKKHIRY